MVYVTGDCHGNFQRFGMRYLPGQKAMDRDDYIIVCGDFGFWSDTPEEEYWLDWLEEKPFTILWADGNHENFTRLNELPVHEWHGGKVHFIRPHVIHLMRGQLYNIEGHTFFTMGGAQSHDIEDGILDPETADFEETLRRLRDQGRKRFRILGRSWWPEELPSDAEYMEALNTLERIGWKADYVITHCAPHQHRTDYEPALSAGCPYGFSGAGQQETGLQMLVPGPLSRQPCPDSKAHLALGADRTNTLNIQGREKCGELPHFSLP